MDKSLDIEPKSRTDGEHVFAVNFLQNRSLSRIVEATLECQRLKKKE